MLSLQKGMGISRAASYSARAFFDQADDSSDASAVVAGKTAVYAVKPEPASSLGLVPHKSHDSHEGPFLYCFSYHCCVLIFEASILFVFALEIF